MVTYTWCPLSASAHMCHLSLLVSSTGLETARQHIHSPLKHVTYGVWNTLEVILDEQRYLRGYVNLTNAERPKYQHIRMWHCCTAWGRLWCHSMWWKSSGLFQRLSKRSANAVSPGADISNNKEIWLPEVGASLRWAAATKGLASITLLMWMWSSAVVRWIQPNHADSNSYFLHQKEFKCHPVTASLTRTG